MNTKSELQKTLERARALRDSAQAVLRSALDATRAAQYEYDVRFTDYCEALEAVGMCPHCHHEPGVGAAEFEVEMGARKVAHAAGFAQGRGAALELVRQAIVARPQGETQAIVHDIIKILNDKGAA